MSDRAPPILYTWLGDSFVPAGRNWQRMADRYFVIGMRYAMEPHEERSNASHRHFFACVDAAFENLPEQIAKHFPNVEALRKHALIKTGYCLKRSIVLESEEQAIRVAAFVEHVDDYAIVQVTQMVVTVYTALSQSVKAMGRDEFEQSKRDVLDFLSGVLGVSVEDLSRHAMEQGHAPAAPQA